MNPDNLKKLLTLLTLSNKGFPSGGIPEMPVNDILGLKDTLVKEAENAGEYSGENAVYEDVLANNPALRSAMVFAENNTGSPADPTDAIKQRIGAGAYSPEDIAGMDDSDLDLDTIELLKRYGLR